MPTEKVRGVERKMPVKERAVSRAVWALLVFVLLVHISSATYSCCSEQRRGTVCTLAGSGEALAIDSSNASTAAIFGPSRLALNSPYIIVSGYYEHRLRIIHANSTVATLAGGGTMGSIASSYVDSDDPLKARFWYPEGVCVDVESTVLLCDCYNHRIRTVLRNGSVRTVAGGGPTGYELGGYADSADPLQARFCHPSGIISVVENGQRLIVIGGNYDHRIRVIYANMTVSTLAGSGGVGRMNCGFVESANPLTARFCHPVGVACDHNGNIIVADESGNRVRKVWRDGSLTGVTTIAGCGPTGESPAGGSSIDSDNPLEASFFMPIAVTTDGVGNILVSGVYEHRVRIIFTNGSVRTLAGSGPSARLTSSTTGGFVDNVPLLQARFSKPDHLALDREGNIVISDFSNNRVRMLCSYLPVLAAPSPSRSVKVLASASASATASLSPPPSRTPSAVASRTDSIETASAVATLQTCTASATSTALHTVSPTIPGPGTDPPSLAAQKGMTVATTSAALVAATATGGGVELQGAIVLGMMDCSNAYVRKVSDGSSRFVTLLYDQSAAMRVLGNLLVAAAALLLHCAAVVAVRLHGGCSTIGEAAAKCRFPGLSHRIFVLCFQGLLLESLRGVVRHSDDTSALGASVCSLVVCVCVPALVAVQCAGASREVAYSPYVVALTKYPIWLRGLLLPRGWWSRTDDTARRWGSLFFFTAGPSRSTLFCLLPYVRPAAMSVAAVVTEVPCTGRMVFLGCLHALLVACVLGMRPHRVGLAGCGSATMDVLVVCMIAMTLAPESDATSRGISWVVSAMGIVSFVLVVLQVLLLVLERGWVRHEESASAAHGALNVPLQDVVVDCNTRSRSCAATAAAGSIHNPQPPPSLNPLEDAACLPME